MMSNRVVFLSNVLRRRLIHGSSILTSLTEQQTDELKIIGFDLIKMLNISNTSIKPYLNLEKLKLLQAYYQTQSELKCTYNFVIDEDVAKDIVKNIVTDEERRKGIIVEGNPGLGLITANLINSGASYILVFDNSEIQEISLTQMLASHPQKITKKASNMNKSADNLILSSLDLGRQHSLPVTIVGISTAFYFIRGLVINFVKYNLWPSRLNVFVVVSTNVWNVINTNRAQKQLKFPISSIFHLLFTIEKIASYPRMAFLPLSKQYSEDMYLVKISVNQNAFKIIDRNELSDYFYFLKILGTSLSNFVIPTLEKWLPDCGPYLIGKGISMTTQVQDLTHEEALRLYLFLKECDGYSDFKACFSHIFSTVYTY